MDAATLRTVQGPLLEALVACAGVTLRGGVDTSIQLYRA